MRFHIDNKILVILSIFFAFFLTACGKKEEIDFSRFDKELKLEYAKEFKCFYNDSGEVLVNIGDDYTVFSEPPESIYISGTGSMDYFIKLDTLQNIKFSSIKADGWSLSEAASAMEEGSIKYAGKYSAPDYEMLLNEKCDLIICNSMIYHVPEVLNKLKELGFKVIVDQSTYEDTLEGRMEWIKLYGIITGHSDKAEEVFDTQINLVSKDYEYTGKNIAFFNYTSNGDVVIRKSGDYVSKMIEYAGGNNVFKDLSSEEETGTMRISKEVFYERLKNTDFLIYNSSMGGDIYSLKEILDRFPLLENTEVVKSGNVFKTDKSLYQAVMNSGNIVDDINSLMTMDEVTFFHRLQ